jgi:hypothetical protein
VLLLARQPRSAPAVGRDAGAGADQALGLGERLRKVQRQGFDANLIEQ